MSKDAVIIFVLTLGATVAVILAAGYLVTWFIPWRHNRLIQRRQYQLCPSCAGIIYVDKTYAPDVHEDWCNALAREE